MTISHGSAALPMNMYRQVNLHVQKGQPVASLTAVMQLAASALPLLPPHVWHLCMTCATAEQVSTVDPAVDNCQSSALHLFKMHCGCWGHQPHTS